MKIDSFEKCSWLQDVIFESVNLFFYKDSSSGLWIFLETKVASIFIANILKMNQIILIITLNLKNHKTFFLKTAPLMIKIYKKWEAFPTIIQIFSLKMNHNNSIVSPAIVLMMDLLHADILKKEVPKILKKLKIFTLKFIAVHTIVVKKSSILNQGLFATRLFTLEKSLFSVIMTTALKVSTKNLTWTDTKKFTKMRNLSFATNVVNHSQQQQTWNSIHKHIFQKKKKENNTHAKWKDAIKSISIDAISKNIRCNMMIQSEILWCKMRIKEMSIKLNFKLDWINVLLVYN